MPIFIANPFWLYCIFCSTCIAYGFGHSGALTSINSRDEDFPPIKKDADPNKPSSWVMNLIEMYKELSNQKKSKSNMLQDPNSKKTETLELQVPKKSPNEEIDGNCDEKTSLEKENAKDASNKRDAGPMALKVRPVPAINPKFQMNFDPNDSKEELIEIVVIGGY